MASLFWIFLHLACESNSVKKLTNHSSTAILSSFLFSIDRMSMAAARAASARTKQIYRVCLREARKHDQHPAAKAMLSPNMFNKALQPYVSLQPTKDRFLRELFSSGQYYRPNVRLTDVVKDILRGDEEKGREGLDLSEATDRDFTIRLSRVLNRNNGMAKRLKITEDSSEAPNTPQPIRAKLAVNAQRIPKPPSIGSILVAHPLVQPNQRFSIMIVTDLGNQAGRPTSGLVVNVQQTTSLKNSRPDSQSSGMLLKTFGDDKAFTGGFADRKLSVLHPFEEIPDCRQLIPGVYLGGDTNYIDNMISSKQAQLHDFKIFLGQHIWKSYDELCDEILQNKWIQMHENSPDISVIPLSRLRNHAPNQLQQGSGAAITMSKQSWGDVMYAFGGEFRTFVKCADISSQYYDGLWRVAEMKKNTMTEGFRK